MAITLVINGTAYQYPVAGEDPGWGVDGTEWAEAVTEALNTLLAPGDILDTSFTIANNIGVATDINGLVFDPGTIRAANVDYSVYRTSTANPSGHAEVGTLFLIYDDSASSGQKWQLSQRSGGYSGVTFSITDAGQVQYTSTDINSTNYSGVIRFRAKTLSK